MLNRSCVRDWWIEGRMAPSDAIGQILGASNRPARRVWLALGGGFDGQAKGGGSGTLSSAPSSAERSVRT